jgi:hypothetical protein
MSFDPHLEEWVPYLDDAADLILSGNVGLVINLIIGFFMGAFLLMIIRLTMSEANKQ